MVSWIFFWAHKAMGNFKVQIIELLSGETEDSQAIIEALGHTIYQKLYRYFNLKIPSIPAGETSDETSDSLPTLPPQLADMIQSVSKTSPAPGMPGMDLLAKQFGLSPEMLQYLPLVQKFLGKKGSDSPGESPSGDRW